MYKYAHKTTIYETNTFSILIIFSAALIHHLFSSIVGREKEKVQFQRVGCNVVQVIHHL